MQIFATSRHFSHIVWKKSYLFLNQLTNRVLKKLLDQKMSFTKVVGNFTYQEVNFLCFNKISKMRIL